ncbi:MAG: hypothetical protein ABJQ70_07135 [Roseobacter sp.]
MPNKTISSSIRTTRFIAGQIDEIASKSGFQSRSKFMIHAALNYRRQGDEPLVEELARMSFALHQVRRAGDGKLHLLKPRDISLISRRLQGALSSVIERRER